MQLRGFRENLVRTVEDAFESSSSSRARRLTPMIRVHDRDGGSEAKGFGLKFPFLRPSNWEASKTRNKDVRVVNNLVTNSIPTHGEGVIGVSGGA